MFFVLVPFLPTKVPLICHEGKNYKKEMSGLVSGQTSSTERNQSINRAIDRHSLAWCTSESTHRNTHIAITCGLEVFFLDETIPRNLQKYSSS